MKTSKGALIGLAALGLVYAGSSWWLGKQVEARYQSLMDRVVSQIGADKVGERRYERAWFGAQSTVVLQFALPAQPAKTEATDGAAHTVRITLQDDIRHGPLAGWRSAAARVHTRLVGVEGVSETLRQAFAQASAPEFVTYVGWGGGLSGQMRLAAGTASDPREPRTRAEWQAMSYDYEVAPEWRRVEGRMVWPGALLDTVDPADKGADQPDATRLQIAGLDYRFDVRSEGEQWLLAPGEGRGTLASMTMSVQRGAQGTFEPVMALQGLEMKSLTQREGELIDSQQTVVGRGQLGGTELKEVRSEMRLTRIDAQALAAAQKLLMQAASRPSGGPAVGEGLSPEAVQRLVQRFVDARPGYSDQYSATLTSGETASLGWGFAMGESPANRAPTLGHMPWLALLSQAQIDATLRLPKAWLPPLAKLMAQPEVGAEDLSKLAEGLVAQGWLRLEGETYLANGALREGRMQLNGRPFMGGLGR